MCSYTKDNNPLGWEMKATEACFMTLAKVTRKTKTLGIEKEHVLKWQLTYCTICPVPDKITVAFCEWNH